MWTVLNYLLMGMAGGALWLSAILAILGYKMATISYLALASAVAAWGEKFGYWRFIDNFTHAAMLEAATGLGQVGRVSKFEGPHMSANYMLKQTGYLVARKHAARLRR